MGLLDVMRNFGLLAQMFPIVRSMGPLQLCTLTLESQVFPENLSNRKFLLSVDEESHKPGTVTRIIRAPLLRQLL